MKETKKREEWRKKEKEKAQEKLGGKFGGITNTLHFTEKLHFSMQR